MSTATPTIEVEKNKGENPQRAVYRFIKATKRSGLLLEARKRQYYQRPPNDRKQKDSALHRMEKQEEYEELKRWGRL